MDIEALNKIAVKMVEPGTGILAADESTCLLYTSDAADE